jgi:hypothetical protein
MESNAYNNVMSEILLQNGYRANQQQRSTARPPGLCIPSSSFYMQLIKPGLQPHSA